MTLALTGGTVVRSLDPPHVEVADVLVEGGRIAAVGQPIPAGVPRRDCAGCLVVPGNVCGHTHLYSALARGMPYGLEPPRSFVDILRRVWWRLDRALDADAIRASALVGGLEALLAGTTTLVDHHASPAAVDGSLDLIAEALAELGVRSVLCYETSDRDGSAAARAGLAENRRFIEATAAGRWPLARAMVGAHASFTLSPETLEACAALAGGTGRGLHVHVAEDAADEQDSLDRYGMRVVERLAESGALDRRTVLAHGVHLDAGELERVASAGATIVHNPRSNLNNGVGYAAFTAPGLRIALGTDGVGADMFEEGRVGYLRRREGDVTTSPGWALTCLAESARRAGDAFGEPLLGRIEPAAPADLAVLDVHLPTPLDSGSLASHWVFGLTSGAVRDVLVAGRLVVAGRRPTLVDADAVAAHGRGAAGRLWTRLESIDEHPFAPGIELAATGRRG